MNAGDLEPLLGIECAVVRIQPPATVRNYADSAPGTVRHLEDLGQQLLRLQVSPIGHDALVSIFDMVLALLQLNHRAPYAVEQIERLESGDHDGNLEPVGQ